MDTYVFAIDSLVSSQVYEIVKTIYSTTAHETTEEGRIKVLQSTLGQLRLNNIATLDAIMTHFTRLLELTSADEAYVSALAQNLAPCILRPRVENSLTMNERHSYRLIRDLFDHKDEIFGELKRQSGTLGLVAGANRPRAISTDESNRRAAMEARTRAIVDRSRASSPAAAVRKHRRDRSSGASEMGRFPINVGSPQAVDRRKVIRGSLEIPQTTPPSCETEHSSNGHHTGAEAAAADGVDGHATDASASAATAGAADSPAAGSDGSQTPTPTATTSTPSSAAEAGELEKRNSLTRSVARGSRKSGFGSRSGFPVIPSGSGAAGTSIAGTEPKAVTLEDKPMEDD